MVPVTASDADVRAPVAPAFPPSGGPAPGAVGDDRSAVSEAAQAPVLDALSLVPPGGRVVMVAPHPDDEILALGATLSALHDAGRAVRIVAVTDGDASHPGSDAWPPERLRTVRPAETAEALRRLGLDPNAVARLGLPDGGVAGREQDLADRLAPLLRPGDVVCVPWRHDGHPDHEACARAALQATRAAGVRCIEFPVWARVEAHPAHAGLRRAPLRRIRVPADLQAAKAHAVEAFRSQLDDDGGTAAVLQPQALRTWLGTDEWVIAP
jgi:LmbE family N-acetylglucosaminyl deacetylase